MEVSVPSTGFGWRSDAIDPCPPADFAVVGEEVNGEPYEEVAAK